jgi:hypothetical protein
MQIFECRRNLHGRPNPAEPSNTTNAVVSRNSQKERLGFTSASQHNRLAIMGLIVAGWSQLCL